MMKFIRLPGIIAFVVIFGVIIGGTVLFAESLIKSYAEGALTEANGARVDIGEIQLQWSPLSIVISNVAITNKDQPMQNTAQIQQTSFVVSLADLFLGKVIVDEMSVTGIKLDTPRKVSGAVVIEKVAEEKTVEADEAESGMKMPDIALPNVKELLKTEPLQSEALFKALNADLSNTEASWKNIKADLEDNARWDAYDRQYKDIQSGLNGNFSEKIVSH